MAKFTHTYSVLHIEDGVSHHTFFSSHERAFKYCEGLSVTVKAVYKKLSVSGKIYTLGALNVFCSYDDQLRLERKSVNCEFKVI